MMNILAIVLIVIGCALVDSAILMLIWLWLDYKEYTEPETYFLIAFIVNTVLLALLLTATIANKMIQ